MGMIRAATESVRVRAPNAAGGRIYRVVKYSKPVCRVNKFVLYQTN
jgi:hypothetical protein